MLTINDIVRASGLQRNTIDQYRRKGKLPKEDGFLGRTPYWDQETIKEWLNSRNA